MSIGPTIPYIRLHKKKTESIDRLKELIRFYQTIRPTAACWISSHIAQYNKRSSKKKGRNSTSTKPTGTVNTNEKCGLVSTIPSKNHNTF